MLYDEIRRNKRNSFLIILIFIGFIVFAVWIYTVAYGLARGEQISLLGIAGAISFLSALLGYYSSDKIALLATGSKEVPREGDYKELHRVVENLAITAGIEKPRVYIMNDAAPNAFATGRNPEHAAISVTTGLLEKLNRTELEGVIAHELSHIRNYDIRFGTIVVVFVGIIAMLGDMLRRMMWYGGGMRRNSDSEERRGNPIIFIIAIAFMILSPLIAKLIQLAMSRQREYLADASGVELTRYPEGLASALEKISNDPAPLKSAGTATAHLFISSPLGKKSSLGNMKEWFSTHPDPAKRIERLRAMMG